MADFWTKLAIFQLKSINRQQKYGYNLTLNGRKSNQKETKIT